jgi:hypothetical protein
MSAVNSVLAAMRAETSVEAVSRLMSDLEASMEHTREVDAIISKALPSSPALQQTLEQDLAALMVEAGVQQEEGAAAAAAAAPAHLMPAQLQPLPEQLAQQQRSKRSASPAAARQLVPA